MRVLVTGGAGFVGSHLVDLLLDRSYDVTVLDDLSTGLASNLSPEVRFLHKDIRVPLVEVFQSGRPDIIVHLAAQVSVPRSLADPHRDLSINVGGTINVLRAAAAVGARKIIMLSSAAVYGVPGELPLTEMSPTSGISPYGLSKLTAEHYVRLLSGPLGIKYTIIRPANIFGPRQTTDGDGAVIPSFLSRFLSGRDPVIHGDGTQTRDFIYVTDMVSAIIQAFDRADGLTLNVSTGIGSSIGETWGLLAQLVGWTSPPVYGLPRPGDIPHSVMANSAAKDHLGWTPQVSLTDGLAHTVAWSRLAQVAASKES